MGQPSTFMVTPQYVQQAAIDTDTTADTIAQQLAVIWQYVAALADEWAGTAHQTFTDVMIRWNADSQNLNSALHGIASGLRTTHFNYTEAELHNNAVLVNVGAGLPPIRLT
jgi:WXG100 family type VII secretion target